MIVADFMTPDPLTVDVDDELDQALRLMDERRVRHLPVLEQGKLVGVLSDRDLLALTGGVRGAGRFVAGGRRVGDHLRREPVTAEPDDSAVSILVEVVLNGIGCLPVVKDGALVGIVTEMDLLREYLKAARSGRLAGEVDPTLEALMTRDVETLESRASLDDAVSLMRRTSVRHIPVRDEDRLAGIFSDRDLRRAQAHGFGAETTVGETMTPDPRTLSPRDTVTAAAELMHEQRISALPIVDGTELVGIVSIPDVLDHCMGTLRLA